MASCNARDTSVEVRGVDLDVFADPATGDADALIATLNNAVTCGLQGTNFGRARAMVQEVCARRAEGGANGASAPAPTMLCSYTSNLISCGLRETFCFLAKHRLVDAFFTTAGGVEEDIIKCLGQTLIGDFALLGADLRSKGLNRVGNLLVPNDNYCEFENFFVPVIEALHAKQRACRWECHTTPSEIIAAVGEAMDSLPNKEESVVYWCFRNGIPMFCPALTDGSMGDMIYFYNFSKKGFLVDPLPDVARARSAACQEGREVCAIVLGGGLPKHHLLSALRSGPIKRVVMVSTGLEADGCESSCNVSDDASHGWTLPEDAVVRVHGDASLLFPLML